MVKKYGPMIKKLQRAINGKVNDKITINKSQVYMQDSGTMIEFITVKRAIYDEMKGHNRYFELFSSTSDVQIVLFLRDYWYEINGWEVPTDNEQWNEAKRKYEEKKAKGKKDEDNTY